MRNISIEDILSSPEFKEAMEEIEADLLANFRNCRPSDTDVMQDIRYQLKGLDLILDTLESKIIT